MRVHAEADERHGKDAARDAAVVEEVGRDGSSTGTPFSAYAMQKA